MKVYDKRIPTTVPFKDIQPGECFIDQNDNELNIKLDISYFNDRKGCFNAVVLEDGQAWQCDDDEQVIKVRATVTID